ncbi:MAG TPA: TatD family hydrolase [Candidatus Saccharimonadales bacterium]|jgi:TatD DNase family protein|nr:TatD family hydrolase [Candidatus Saccharimonadales bacterium]
MQLTDTHCHIQEAPVKSDDATGKLWTKRGNPSPDELIAAAAQDDVTRLICVGCTLADSRRAVELVGPRENMWASIGIHPHDAKDHVHEADTLVDFAALAAKPKVVAVGECGLDFYYNHSSKDDQIQALRFQMELALKHDLPMIFHVRDAFDDFWPIFDSYKGLRGVVHSFTATRKELDEVLSRGLYVGLNGIMTFTKNQEQLDAAKAIPLQKLLLETDAPFLTPDPYRGTVCEPKHTRVTAAFLARLRDESLEILARETTHNAKSLFRLS